MTSTPTPRGGRGRAARDPAHPRRGGSPGVGDGAGAPLERARRAPSQRTRRAEPARYAAWSLLRAVAGGAYANLELPRILRRMRLSTRDAAFATELAFGTLRWRGLYDAIIAVAADRPTEAIDDVVLDVLRLGVHQLLGMRVPEHAATDQTVGLARAVTGQGTGGFVNAVMRRVTERTRQSWLAAVTTGDGSAADLAIAHSHPEWVVIALRQALLGHQAATPDTVDAELTALLVADNEPPKVTLVARPGLIGVDELARAVGPAAHPSRLSPTGLVLPAGDPGALEAVREGRAAVQDEGSQLVALAVAAAPLPAGLPPVWLDLCAGPGGKSGVLGALAVQHGNDFTAVEVAPHRADLVRATLAALSAHAGALGRTVEVRTADGREVGTGEPAAFAKVLVDVPCTGLGALRRRPEARWRRSPADLTALGPLQRDLLRSALNATAPGGLVGYATCSPHLAETTFVVRDVVKRRIDVEVVDARGLFVDAAGEHLVGLGDGPFVQLWPHRHGTDAMFFALLRRTAQ